MASASVVLGVEATVPMLGPTQTAALDGATSMGVVRGRAALFLGIP